MNKTAPRREAVVAALASGGPRGLNAAKVVAATKIARTVCAVLLSQYAKAGQIFGVGPNMSRRYFADASHAAAYSAVVDAEIAAKAQAYVDRQRLRQAVRTEARRLARQAVEATKPPKPEKPASHYPTRPANKASPAPAQTPWRADNSKPEPVRMPKRAKVQEIVVPDCVVVQRCLGYQDGRYAVTVPIVGGYYSEWINKRGAA